MRRHLSDNALTTWVKGQTNNALQNATSGVQNSLNSLKTPTVTIELSPKTKNTIFVGVGILAFGLIMNGYLRKK